MNRSELLPVALIVVLLTASIAISLYVWSVGHEGASTPPPAGRSIQMRDAAPGDTIKRESMYGLMRVTRLAYVGDVYEGVGEDTREIKVVAREVAPERPVVVISEQGIEYTVPVNERVFLVPARHRRNP